MTHPLLHLPVQDEEGHENASLCLTRFVGIDVTSKAPEAVKSLRLVKPQAIPSLENKAGDPWQGGQEDEGQQPPGRMMAGRVPGRLSGGWLQILHTHRPST